MSTPGPWASIRPARDAARVSARAAVNAGAKAGSTTYRSMTSPDLAPWRLDVDERGDLVAVHDDGTTRVLATIHKETSE